MSFIRFSLAAFAAMVIATSAQAQTVGIGTTKGGATAQTSAGIAKIVSTHSGLQMRPQAMAGTNQYIPVVNNGELEFGIANMMQTKMAWTGTGLSEGEGKSENLRLTATMMVFETALIVRKDSPIKTMADLKGKRIGHGFDSATLFQFIMSGFLANAGVSWNDVQKVPNVSLQAHYDAFKEGKIDAVIASVGSAIVQEFGATVPGGVRYLSLENSDRAKQAMLKDAPSTFISVVNPAPQFPGVEMPTNVLAFDYMLWTHKGVSDDIVYRVTKAMYENEKELKELGPLWRSHFSKNMAKDQGMPYHPGAIKFFKEAGIWGANRPAS